MTVPALEPGIGRIQVEQIVAEVGETDRILSLKKCTDEELESAASYWEPRLGDEWHGLKQLTDCVDSDELYIKGDTNSGNSYKTLEFEIVHCLEDDTLSQELKETQCYSHEDT